MTAKSTPEMASFRRRLTAWFRRQGRDLPWRRTRDPYRVLVSEVMLQQTQVSRVLEFYPRFLARYPTMEHLARAGKRQVREAWEGLGYYRRIVNLHRLARQVMREQDGSLQPDAVALRQLPGVGRYTAGALMTFAFERPHPAVDTNVARVLRRYFYPRARRTGARLDERLWATAQALQPRNGRTAWSFNQAIMELGALICTARVARCEVCPVRRGCQTGRPR